VPQASDDHLVNPVKEKLKAGGVALGMTVRLGRSPDIARIARATGHDFLSSSMASTQFSISRPSAPSPIPRWRSALPRWCAYAASTTRMCRCCSTTG
jgi:hypothetical protein